MAKPDLTGLGRYRIVRVLGRGAMGVVYEGFDPKLERKVAVKTILKTHLDERTAEDYSMRFQREARGLARLSHPNIVQVHDFGEEGDIAYLVMEFIRGKDLKSFFDASQRFHLKEAVRIVCELCEALDFAHRAGIVHRDVKPANLMLDLDMHAKLTDFGVARIQGHAASHVSQSGAMVGTPAYMSPEQINGEPVDARSDVFSTGIVLYQFLTGEMPFTGGPWTVAKKIVHEEPALPSAIDATISPLFDAVVARALAKQPAHRYQSAKALAAALKRALEGKPDDADATVPLIAGKPTGAPARASTPDADVEFWRSIKDGNDPDDFELYVRQFPDGIYAALARRRMAKLRGEPLEETEAKAREQEKKEAEEAARREAEVQAKIAAERARLEAEMALKEEEYRKREADAEARRIAAEKARLEAEENARREAAEIARREAERVRKEAEELARREAERAKQEAAAELARREAEFKKREAEAEARREAAEKARAAAEETAKREAEAARAKKEAEERARRETEEKARLEAQLKSRAEQEARQKADFDRREAELRKRVQDAESKPGGKKHAIRLASIVGVAVFAIAAATILLLPKEDPEALARLQGMQKQLEETRKRAEALEAARQKEEHARIALERARDAEAEAKKFGDAAKQKELAEARIKAETEAKKQADAARAAEQEKLAAEKRAEEAKARAEARKIEEAKRAAAERALAERLAAEKAAAEAEEKAKAEAARKAAEQRALAEAEKKATLEAEARARREARAPGRVFRDCPECPEMVVIAAGEFTMGSPATETGRDDDEGPMRTVRIAQPFALGRTEVTVAAFRRFVDDSRYRTEAERNVRAQGCAVWVGKWEWRPDRSWRSPGFDQTDRMPVVCVSWNDARAYAEWLSKKTGERYRLPSEAEWEYAARGGSATARSWGDDPDKACEYANVADQTTHEGKSWSSKHNCNDGHWFTAPVASYKPNRFGLYDMLGNAWEWTEDCWNASYNGAPTDGGAWLTGDCGRRVARGGSWDSFPRYVRSANRCRDSTVIRNSNAGFRLARTLE